MTCRSSVYLPIQNRLLLRLETVVAHHQHTDSDPTIEPLHPIVGDTTALIDSPQRHLSNVTIPVNILTKQNWQRLPPLTETLLVRLRPMAMIIHRQCLNTVIGEPIIAGVPGMPRLNVEVKTRSLLKETESAIAILHTPPMVLDLN